MMMAGVLMVPPTTGDAARPRKKSRTQAKTESRADLQKQQATAQKEIADTRAKIKENDREVSRNLAELGKLEGDIAATKAKVTESTRQVNALQTRIGVLEGQISAGEAQLARMREGYLKAIKQMRARKGSNSRLAYIFSSKSLGEARRRMRYLREFNDWRVRKQTEIQGQIRTLQGQRQDLAQSKTQKDKALATQVAAQRNLQVQYKQQDALVVQLKANGTALKNHLAQKQAEVNQLRSRVSALIAAEEAQRREAERRAAEQRAAEQRAAEQRAAEQRLAEQRAAEQKEREERVRAQAEADAKAKADARAEADAKAKADAKAEKASRRERERMARREKEKREDQERAARQKRDEKSKSGNSSYADARKRAPRGKTGVSKETDSKQMASVARPSAGVSGFAGMRGKLPRPVSGSFRVTSRFGRHSLPDLPDVMYDNPGIDAEVAAGAAANAVYGGKVSGVYMIPGFSTVVIVNHGDYYTVYGNLSAASVRVGDIVKQGQALGRVAPSEDDTSHGSIHFEVWKNRDKQDPLGWIR